MIHRKRYRKLIAAGEPASVASDPKVNRLYCFSEMVCQFIELCGICESGQVIETLQAILCDKLLGQQIVLWKCKLLEGKLRVWDQ